MQYQEFLEQMTLAAICSQSELLEPTLTIYWEKFKGWKASDFESAVGWCGDNLSGRFPSVRDIKDAKPKTYDTIEKIEKRTGITSYSEQPWQHANEAIENQIDAMDDEELNTLFAPLFEYSKVCQTEEQKQKAIDFSIRQFRRNPRGYVYRGFIRDSINSIS